MNLQRAAEIQVLLEGVKLPATRVELVRYAARENPGAANELAQLPDRRYDHLDEVGEELAPTQPVHVAKERLPRPESGRPPGGDDYLRPFPTSGRVEIDAPPDNPPQKAIEHAAETQKKQQQDQSG
jgi:hypothetical protein